MSAIKSQARSTPGGAPDAGRAGVADWALTDPSHTAVAIERHKTERKRRDLLMALVSKPLPADVALLPLTP